MLTRGLTILSLCWLSFQYPAEVVREVPSIHDYSPCRWKKQEKTLGDESKQKKNGENTKMKSPLEGKIKKHNQEVRVQKMLRR